MLHFLGTLLLGLLIILVSLIICIMLFVKFAKVFGAKPSEKQKLSYQKYSNYQDGKFVNLMPNNTVLETPNFVDDSLEPKASRQPDFDIPYVKINPKDLEQKTKHARFTWFGHSTFLLEMDGKNIMIDPMLSAVPSPVQGIGRKRYSKGLPLTIAELPALDAVLITHDHYDHLDYLSIKALKDKVKMFYVPLGVSAHLMAWGISMDKIQELNWYEQVSLGEIELTLTPTHHYSGRSLTDRFQSLWGGWIIKGQYDNIYLSGDGGYGPHFREIGAKYGPFDFAMIECGQYSRYWRQNHLFPEQSAQVAEEVGAKLVMPIHWGAFTLAMHRWNAPVERFLAKIKTFGIAATTPQIGQQFVLDPAIAKPTGAWWEKP